MSPAMTISTGSNASELIKRTRRLSHSCTASCCIATMRTAASMPTAKLSAFVRKLRGKHAAQLSPHSGGTGR